MRISEVKTSKCYGKFYLRDSGPNLIGLNWEDDISVALRKDRRPTVYLFVVDSIIKKIGGSADKRGIEGTMSFYLTSQQGSPGAPRFILHHLIARELQTGKAVELHAIRSSATLAKVPGLLDVTDLEVHPFKEMEQRCVNDYFDRMDGFPEWNFQESHTDYPSDLAQLYNEYHANRLEKKSD